MNEEERKKRDRDYQRRRRAAGLSWDQRPQNVGRANARKRRYQERRIDEGRCSRCGGPLLSEWYCWDCLNKLQFGALERQAAELGLDVDPI